MVEKIEQLPIEGKVNFKKRKEKKTSHLCTYYHDHLIY